MKARGTDPQQIKFSDRGLNTQWFLSASMSQYHLEAFRFHPRCYTRYVNLYALLADLYHLRSRQMHA